MTKIKRNAVTRPPRQWVNIDGEDMIPLYLTYDLCCDCEFAFEKLWTLAKGYKKSELLSEAKHDAEGRLLKVLLPWIDRLKPRRPGMGPLILGEISIETGFLEIDVNSIERAERIQRKVSRRIGGKTLLHGQLAWEMMEEGFVRIHRWECRAFPCE